MFEDVYENVGLARFRHIFGLSPEVVLMVMFCVLLCMRSDTGDKGSRALTLKFEIVLTGDLAVRSQELLARGYFSSKPEIVRQALRELFSDIEEKELLRARLSKLDSL